MIITASGSMRGAKRVDLKKIVDAAAAAAAQKGHKVRMRAPVTQPECVTSQRPHAHRTAGRKQAALEACSIIASRRWVCSARGVIPHGCVVLSQCRPNRLGT